MLVSIRDGLSNSMSTFLLFMHHLRVMIVRSGR